MAYWRDSKIKDVIQKILIYIFFFTGIPYFRFLSLRKKGPVVRTLVMHDVTNKDKFVSFFDFLQCYFNVLSVGDFEHKRFDDKKINILLSFDDGFESWETVVVPELERRKISAYFFVSSGFLDMCGDKEKETQFCRKNLLISHRKPLSWEGLKRLSANNAFVVGGHTVTHPNLLKISMEQQQTEIVENKKRLEEFLGTEVEVFAYPFGMPGMHADKRLCEVVQKAGFKKAFTTEINFTEVTKDQFSLARVCTEYKESPFFLYVWIMGGYDNIKKLMLGFRISGVL